MLHTISIKINGFTVLIEEAKLANLSNNCHPEFLYKFIPPRLIIRSDTGLALKYLTRISISRATFY
jgi:hypothetical protein